VRIIDIVHAEIHPGLLLPDTALSRKSRACDTTAASDRRSAATIARLHGLTAPRCELPYR